MKTKQLATYPINYIGNISDKLSNDRIFDDKSRDSYFRSLEIAQKNLITLVKK